VPEELAAYDPGGSSQSRSVEGQLTNQIEARLTNEITVSLRKLGKSNHRLVRRFILTKVFYLTSKTDAGGFGIGFDITCQAQAALGRQINRNILSGVARAITAIRQVRNQSSPSISLRIRDTRQ
jgi:hypothetical protein